ncbi:glycoside hydrolase family 28 protein [Celeribacter sp.]|uniref:polygalacturonase PglA n=1 Tax=Celeribacter sp. TaxID=1890673 RepID=UPI003A94BC81
MATLESLCVTSRTATVLLTPDGARFTLPAPIAWRVTEATGAVVATGTAVHAPVFIEDLTPASDYTFTCDLGSLSITTPACAGLIDAATFGVNTTANATTNAAAFARAIAAVPTGGTLTVPAGIYATYPLFLKSDMTFYLPEGAQLAAPETRHDWPILSAYDDRDRVLGTWEGQPEPCFAALITAIDANGLRLTGRGVIDGGGDRGDWWTWPKETRDGARRPRTIHLAYSDDVHLSGLTVLNSPSWTIHPYRCDGFLAAALYIQNPPDSPNTDGLDPESCLDARLVGLDFSVGDDCIAVKAGKRGDCQSAHLAPTRRLTVSHSRMARGHGAVVLGSEMSGSITDIDIYACEFVGTDRGLRLKTRRGRGGKLARISMRDVLMDGVGTAFSANAFYFCDIDGKSDAVQNRAPSPVSETTPIIHDITLDRIHARNVATAAVALLGLPEAPITGVTLSNFSVGYDPSATEDIPLMACGVAPVRHGGIIATFADISGTLTLVEPQKDHALC